MQSKKKLARWIAVKLKWLPNARLFLSASIMLKMSTLGLNCVTKLFSAVEQDFHVKTELLDFIFSGKERLEIQRMSNWQALIRDLTLYMFWTFTTKSMLCPPEKE